MDSYFHFSGPIPPQFQEVRNYFTAKGISAREAEDFFLLHEKRHWRSSTGNPLKSWKPAAYKWIAGTKRKLITDRSCVIALRS
ncbi:MAG TPA: hypothetical protein VHE34_21230 [Puia sp.]|uniref:hypothetical protein n=1 Tax=Puia sp. TaxID=2045100 RepID=UPI002B5D24FD|nr:hypothetical protein [Puia sp.]HVU97767.1 hypothetical protein [Puia sp.]